MWRKWRELGFYDLPVLVAARGGESLYRVWGGYSTEMAASNPDGLTLSLVKANSRKSTESALAVIEYGNAVRWITHFQALARLPMWVGKVDPGDRPVLCGNVAGSQVFIERQYLSMLRKVSAPILLRNDMPGITIVKNRSKISS